jgi:ribonuclease-3
VNTVTLGEVGRELGLGRLLRLGRGERKSGGRRKVKLLANTTEAVLGAIYLDGGIAKAQIVVDRWMSSRIDHLIESSNLKDPRTALQELTQARWQTTPTYRMDAQVGAAHDPLFRVTVMVGDREHGSGEGRTKQQARRAAAKAALEALAEEPTP